MLARLAKKAWSYGAPTLISLARLISSSGSALFSLMKFFILVVRSTKNPYLLPLAGLLIFSNLIVNFGTRIPTIFWLFHPSKHPQPTTPKQKDNANEPKISTKLGYSGYLFLKTLGIISAGFVSFNSYLGFITLYEFFVTEVLNQEDPYNEEWKSYLIQFIAVFFAVSNFISYTTFNLEEFNRNAIIFIEAMEKGELDIKKKPAWLAFGFSLFGMVCVPLLGFFSTVGSLGKIPKWAFTLPEKAKFAIAIFSSCTAFINQLFTQVPNVYRVFAEWNQPSAKYSEQIRAEKFIRVVVTMASIADSLGTGLSNWTGAVNTVSGIAGIDLEKPSTAKTSLEITASVFAAFNTGSYFAFTQRGLNRMLNKQHERSGHTRVKNVERTPLLHDIEAGTDTRQSSSAVPINKPKDSTPQENLIKSKSVSFKSETLTQNQPISSKPTGPVEGTSVDSKSQDFTQDQTISSKPTGPVEDQSANSKSQNFIIDQTILSKSQDNSDEDPVEEIPVYTGSTRGYQNINLSSSKEAATIANNFKRNQTVSDFNKFQKINTAGLRQVKSQPHAPRKNHFGLFSSSTKTPQEKLNRIQLIRDILPVFGTYS